MVDAFRDLVEVQENGQIALPVALRERWGLKEGDLVAVVETDDGVLIGPRELLAVRALDEMGAALREKGVTLDEWIESGREVRAQLVKERYGIRADSSET